jgi:hypothetical protein
MTVPLNQPSTLARAAPATDARNALFALRSVRDGLVAAQLERRSRAILTQAPTQAARECAGTARHRTSLRRFEKIANEKSRRVARP